MKDAKLSNSYLDIAESVLRRRQQPLNPREILADAYVNDAVPGHLYGKTQEKTLQARLSEDISRLRERSTFFRTNRARFFLREFLNVPSIPEAFKTEYLARQRRKDLRNERVLAFNGCRTVADELVILLKTELDDIFSSDNYRYAILSDVINNSDNEVPVYSFLIFHNGTEVLTHFSGQYTEENHPSKGFRSLGFGSAVRALDGDMLYEAYYGIIGSAINELIYGLGISHELVRRARYEDQIRLHCAIGGNDDRVGPYLQTVMSYRCPDDFSISKASLSLNRLIWVRPDSIEETSDFDAPSEKLIKSGRLMKILRCP